jgi:hypothetical protein
MRRAILVGKGSEMNFVMCINNKSYERDLIRHKVYKVYRDEKNERHGWIRVIDETGEDDLYPGDHFVPVQIPEEAESGFNVEDE